VRIYYLDESENSTHFVRSAIGVDEEVWNEVFQSLQEWRKEIIRKYHIPLYVELHATDLLAGRGLIVREGKTWRRVRQDEAAAIFVSAFQRFERIAIANAGFIEVINVSLEKRRGTNRTLDSLDRIINRINTSVSQRRPSTRAFLIFDEGKEKQTVYSYRKMRAYNPIPSKLGSWPDTGEQWKNIPIQNVVGGPAFRSSAGDYFLQMADFVAHALLKHDENPTLPRIARYGLENAFDILDQALNKRAHAPDPKGVVRR
jgi:hypothetical protein